MSGLYEIYFELDREDLNLGITEADYVISNKDLLDKGYMEVREIYLGQYRYILYRRE